ncbi:MAG: ABC transporter ATP-binding protein [Planctomycetes bacterium]|nr:ABC transporter ATP-binding protein [Planctomycetota bacterium]
MIELRNVAKRFGALVVLDNLNLSIEEGKTTVVIGESGTGKSVLLKHIVGLLRPDSGEVFFQNTRIDNLDEEGLVPFRRRMGFLFQLSALFDSMSVGENVAFPVLQHSAKSAVKTDEIVAETLRKVGLEGFQNRRPGELSGGQKKRVALARAIALNPEVVLYDEPTTGLDPVRADVINELILKMGRELKATSIVVTHDMISAYKVAHRIVMLDKGRIIADGPPDYFRKTDDQKSDDLSMAVPRPRI